MEPWTQEYFQANWGDIRSVPSLATVEVYAPVLYTALPWWGDTSQWEYTLEKVSQHSQQPIEELRAAALSWVKFKAYALAQDEDFLCGGISALTTFLARMWMQDFEAYLAPLYVGSKFNMAMWYRHSKSETCGWVGTAFKARWKPSWYALRQNPALEEKDIYLESGINRIPMGFQWPQFPVRATDEYEPSGGLFGQNNPWRAYMWDVEGGMSNFSCPWSRFVLSMRQLDGVPSLLDLQLSWTEDEWKARLESLQKGLSHA
jgi:hypothetical protein